MIDFREIIEQISVTKDTISNQETQANDIEGTNLCESEFREFYFDSARAERLALILKALGDPIRLKLILLITQSADGSACVCNLNQSFDISQPTLSHHLKILKDAEVLKKTKRGTWAYYSLNPAMVPLVNIVSHQITNQTTS